MTRTTSSLDTFDFLELLYMLTEQGRSGALYIYRPDGQFQAWLERGLVMHMQFGDVEGTAALTRLLREPRGRFHFDEGVTHPEPRLEAPLDEIALEALNDLELDDLGFDGPARLVNRDRINRLRWSLKEQDIMQQIDAQRPMSDLSQDPDTRRFLQKLYRVGLLTLRKSRVARLTVTITYQVSGVALVDELIFKRWKEDIIRHPQNIAVKTDDGAVYTLPLRSSANITNQLLIPPDLLMRTGLRAGDSVLVRPI